VRIVAIVQARTGSTRLPGKVLADVAGRPLIDRVVARAQAATQVDEVMIATTDLPADDALAEAAGRLSVACHRGSEHDVLSRYRDGARVAGADAVVRITGDCPLIDPAVIDRVVAALTADEPVDLASNVLRRTYPKGLDVEALFSDTLERIHRLARSPAAREHVTWFAYRERPELFLLRSVEHEHDEAGGRNWSVDTPEDLEHVRDLYERFGLADRIRPWTDLLA